MRFSAIVGGLCLLAAFALMLVQCQPARAETVVAPQEALQYKRDLIRNARLVWGLDAPVAVIAAQIHQESRWRANAKSPFASGLAQFTPATAEWIAEAFPGELDNPQPFNPAWSLRAIARYDYYLWTRVVGATPCDRMAFVLAGYNGGPGWVNRESARAAQIGLNSMVYFGSVDMVCLRKPEFCRETWGYASRILLTLQPAYTSWGPGAPCTKRVS